MNTCLCVCEYVRVSLCWLGKDVGRNLERLDGGIIPSIIVKFACLFCFIFKELTVILSYEI